jgi:filamentous hemagglutinin family protein
MAANYSRLDNFFRRRLLAGTAAYGLIAVGSIGLAHAAGALPQGGQVIGGSATINYASPSQLNITSTTNNSAIAWQSFSIGQGNSVTVAQPSANSTQLEQVSGPSASQIFGSLSSNGRIVVANPNGIWFGPSAQVDVAGLVATTAHASAADVATFAAGGRLNLSQAGNATASVVNQGSITISQAGLAAFVAPGVRNDGVIQAKLGKVQLASGTTETVDFYGDGLINLAVTGQTAARAVGPDGKPLAAAVQNTGTINADGGTVLMTANVAAGVVDQVINTTGIVQARAVAQQGGQIILDGGDNGAVMVAGTVDASGRTAGQTGGTVNVLGNSVQLASNAVVDVSGDAGGGTALIGGNFHGSGTQRHAATTTVAKGAKILADAVSSGNGGQVAIWADQSTSFDGTASAKGGAQSGNGGQVETSGAQLSVGNDAVVDASAANGAAGNWDLDPSGNLYLNSTNTVPTGAPSGSSSASTTTIATTLNTGTNVSETANQDLFVISPIAWSTDAHLGLSATHSMYIEAPITATGASAELDLSVNGGTDPWTTLASFGTLSNLETGRLYVLNSNFGNVSGGVTLAATDTLKIDGTTYTLITNNTDFGNINLASGHYALDADLNAPSVSADWSGTFSGVLEGLGHTISNVNIAVSTGTGVTNVGLFGQVGAGGVINDLNLASVTVTTSGTATVDMGGIAGMNNGIIANVSVNNATITSNPTTVPNQTVEGAGGIVGVNGTTGLLITSFASGSNLTSAAKGAGSGSGHVYGIGGAIGANLGAAVGSYAQNATLTSTNNSGVGTDIAGFVGFSNGTILADLYFGSALTITGHNITQGTFAAAGNCISGDAGCTTSAVTVSETGSFTKVYDGTTSASGAVTASGLLDSDQFVDLSAAFPNPNVGSYTLSVDGITVNYGGGITHNYYYTVGLSSATGTITPAPLTITANNVSTEYGTTPVALTGFTPTGLVNGEAITSVTETDANNIAGKDAGTYTNSIVITSGSEVGGNGFLASNYSITLNPGTLTITPSSSPVVITANNVSTEYGTTPVALTGFSVTGLVAGNTLTSVTETDAFNVAAQDAGTYANSIIASNPVGNFKASNYTTVNFVNGNLTITPSSSPVTITANNVSAEYGTTPVALTGFSVTGLVAGNTLTSVTETDAFNVAAQDAGAYTNSIIPSGPTTGTFKASNYTTVNYVNGTLTITPSTSPVTITALPESTGYGTTPITLSGFSVTGLVAGNSINSVTLTDADNVAGKDAGAYVNSIIASNATGTFKASNYTTVNYVPGTFTITPSQSPVVITAADQTQNFGAPFVFSGLPPQFSATGLVAGNTITSVSLTSSGDTTTAPAGTYSIIPSGGTGNFNPANYVHVSYIDGTLTVLGGVPICAATFPQCTVPLNVIQLQAISNPGQSLLANVNPAAGGNGNVENINPAAGGGAAGGSCEQLPDDEEKETCFDRQAGAAGLKEGIQNGNKFLGGQL